jgi:hypothetical protein
MKLRITFLVRAGGIALLFLIFFGINKVYKCHAYLDDLNLRFSTNKKLGADNVQIKDGKFPPKITEDKFDRAIQDTSTLNRVLQEGGFLEQMNSWNGKALFVKLNSIKTSPEFRYYGYNALYKDVNGNKIQDESDQGFFNPASTVKVSIAALVLERLNKLGLTREAEYRTSESSNWFRIDDDIRHSLLISDNDATNRLILWLGFDQINNDLEDKGLYHLVINRLMLNRGTLVKSPLFEIRQENKLIRQLSKSVSVRVSCYETVTQIGNCATESDLVGVLIRIVQPEYLPSDKNFNLNQSDREWLKVLMSHTPREEGFDYPDDYCRFLTEVEHKIASQSGRMLSKCGVALFSNTYVDSSFIEADSGQKYYIVFSVTPPKGIPEKEIIQWMNTTTNFVLLQLP